jgi:hypothetical protein
MLDDADIVSGRVVEAVAEHHAHGASLEEVDQSGGFASSKLSNTSTT